MAQMKLISLDEALDSHFGKRGTPRREQHEAEVAEAIHAYRIGEAIKKARERQNLTQAELGERIGVGKSQISRLERGCSITIPTMSRVFKALGIATGALELNGFGKVELW